jgi:quercetin dioxygenase-like cupin family protein
MHRLTGPGALGSSFARLMRLEYDVAGEVDLAASDQEKIYVCISGEVLLRSPEQDVLLRAGDVCLVPPFCARSIVNRSSGSSELLLIMPQ